MIEAVVRSFDGEPPPSELITAWEVQRWGTLPEAGGLYDQDYVLMRRMRVLSNIHDAMSAWRNLTGKQIHNLTDSQRKIIRALREDGLL